MGLRPRCEYRVGGLDTSEHGEEGYHGDAFGGSVLSPKPAMPSAAAIRSPQPPRRLPANPPNETATKPDSMCGLYDMKN
jgi:hypothetical protein